MGAALESRRNSRALARSASVSQAIADVDVIVFAVWLDALTALVAENNQLLKGKVVVDPTNPIKIENGAMVSSLPEGELSGSVVLGLLPAEPTT